VHAGERYGQSLDILTCLQSLLEEESPSPQLVADTLLEHAMRLDHQRPVDDISIVVMSVLKQTGDEVRRMSVRLPLEPYY